jgi:RES domain
VVKSKNKHRKSRPRARPAILDAFTARDLEVWATRSTDVQAYRDRVYYDLERQRAARYDELCLALRAVPGIEVSVDRWVRVTDWRWNLAPLSAAGSIKAIGGRFNIGSDLDRARGQAFPCLYLAHDVETAYREYFGAPLSSRSTKLTLGEFALRRETSFTTFSLKGQLDQVFDLRERSGLTNFVKIISKFDVSNDTQKFARSAGLPPPPPRLIIKTPHGLQKRLLTPPSVWRLEPQMFGIPATSQIFGRFIRDAGFEAILYPSQQGGETCLAVFPGNFRASASRIEVVGDVPPGASCAVLDKDHLCLDG